MQDCELYGRIVGITAPWRVERRMEIEIHWADIEGVAGRPSIIEAL